MIRKTTFETDRRFPLTVEVDNNKSTFLVSFIISTLYRLRRLTCLGLLIFSTLLVNFVLNFIQFGIVLCQHFVGQLKIRDAVHIVHLRKSYRIVNLSCILIMTTSMSANEHCISFNSVWNNASAYDHHGYHLQPPYQHQQFVNRPMSYDDGLQYVRQYGADIPGAAYRSAAVDASRPGPCFDGSVRHRNMPQDSVRHRNVAADSVSASENMATASVAGIYASKSGTGNGYGGVGGACVEGRQLPDVVVDGGGHLQGWTNHHGACTPPDHSHHQPGLLHSYNTHRANVIISTPLKAGVLSIEMRISVFFLSARISQKPHTAKLHQLFCMLNVAVVRSSSGSVVARYVFPVLSMTSCFHNGLYCARCESKQPKLFRR